MPAYHGEELVELVTDGNPAHHLAICLRDKEGCRDPAVGKIKSTAMSVELGEVLRPPLVLPKVEQEIEALERELRMPLAGLWLVSGLERPQLKWSAHAAHVVDVDTSS